MKMHVKYLKILCNLLLSAAVVLFFFFVLPKILVFFMPFVIGFALSLMANPLIRFLEKKIRIKRKYGTALMIVFVIAVLLSACYGTVHLLLFGVREFMDYLPAMCQNAGAELNEALAQLQQLLHKIPVFSSVDIGEAGAVLSDMLPGFVNDYKGPTVSAVSGAAKSVPNILVSTIVCFLAAYFFITDRYKIMEILKQRIPDSVQRIGWMVYNQILHAVIGYFKAQFKIMIVVYIVIVIGLMLLGVNFAWLIGFGIAFLDMLPVFGTGTVLLPWAAVKILSGNIAIAAGMLILYAVSQAVHHLIQPKMVGESVGLDPFATLFFMYIGYKWKGIIGMIIAIPAGMVLCGLAESGAFDTVIWCVREVIKDFIEFCKINQIEQTPKKGKEMES